MKEYRYGGALYFHIEVTYSVLFGKIAAKRTKNGDKRGSAPRPASF
ncbi:MAG: hypothetical protein IJW70_09125 [Clostridia bacterium]|nr:hypothetical protein [Clostridia bacterium]